MCDRRKGRGEHLGRRRLRPPFGPGVVIICRRVGGRNQPDQELDACDAKIRARPVDGHNRVGLDGARDLGWSNALSLAICTPRREPLIVYKIEHVF